MAKVSVTFGRLELLLSTYFRIDPDRAGTFRARIKQLQRLNFPSGVNVGRGARFDYEIEHLIKLTFAFELLAVGLPAKLATEIIDQGWSRIAVAVQLAAHPWLSRTDDEDIYCIFAPDLLSDGANALNSVLVYEREAFQEATSQDSFKPAAVLSVNVTKLMRRLYAQCDHIRLEKRVVQGEVGKWITILPSLYDDAWVEDWVQVSLEWLERFKPKAAITDDIPF